MVEGALWFDASQLRVTSTYLFSLFSHVLWPVYIPFAIGLVETVPWRRKVIWSFQTIGLGVGSYLLYNLVALPLTAVAAANIGQLRTSSTCRRTSSRFR